ncbi:ribosome biogenesis GTP-binding protein YihA/YsxC [Selenomonas sputigena]|uniref:Probable GTP-binding protein EngB n=1 Tax=Selenomonas sputigena TaxID=69823 RepID=A0ABV3X2C9_9FIRM
MKCSPRLSCPKREGLKLDSILITQGKYIASAVKKEQYPEIKRKEIVFIGRSNVGKSSLINSLSRTKNLARVSGRPGKTQTINFYELGAKILNQEKRIDFYLVDLPGYGYAHTGKRQRKIWARFIEEYLLTSEELQFVCHLMDIRHKPMVSDIEMFRWLLKHGLPVLVIATKADKLSRSIRDKNIAIMRQILGVEDLDILPYSSTKNEGRSELLDVIANVLIE